MSALLLLLACAQPPETVEVEQARRFAALLRAGDAARCAELESPEWRGHCENALGVACEQITAGPWQQECYFARAEANTPRESAERLADCGRSGSFTQECLTHLFKAELEPQLKAAPPSPDVVAMTEQAEALAARWGRELTPWSPPWGWWWRRLHMASATVDRAVCDRLQLDQRRSCQREALSIVRMRWDDGAEDHPELCGQPLDAVRAAVAGDPALAWAPNPDLDEAVQKALAQSCP
ncbi:MAG: hypothetical protein H6741_15880 [Alphaproteobacteria bacterium]|nr:hypothetical protein [Alphaproteobacteria bacterium]